MLHPRISRVIIRWRPACIVEQFACEVVEEVDVAAGGGGGGVEALGDEHQIGVIGGVYLIKIVVDALVAVHGKAVFGEGAEVIGFVEVRRAAKAVVAMGWPA